MDQAESEKPTLKDAHGVYHSSSVSTWELLQDLGFVEHQGALLFDFGTLQLEANQGLTDWGIPLVYIGGVLSTGRVLALIESNLPMEVESREQGLALIFHILGHHSSDLTSRPKWLSEGSRYSHLLPWVQKAAADNARREHERAVYDARPHCTSSVLGPGWL